MKPLLEESRQDAEASLPGDLERHLHQYRETLEWATGPEATQQAREQLSEFRTQAGRQLWKQSCFLWLAWGARQLCK